MTTARIHIIFIVVSPYLLYLQHIMPNHNVMSAGGSICLTSDRHENYNHNLSAAACTEFSRQGCHRCLIRPPKANTTQARLPEDKILHEGRERVGLNLRPDLSLALRKPLNAQAYTQAYTCTYSHHTRLVLSFSLSFSLTRARPHTNTQTYTRSRRGTRLYASRGCRAMLDPGTRAKSLQDFARGTGPSHTRTRNVAMYTRTRARAAHTDPRQNHTSPSSHTEFLCGDGCGSGSVPPVVADH
jgi:hypothetical protein